MNKKLEFPKAILPNVVEKYFNDQHEKLGLVPEYMRLTCIASIGTLIGNKYVVEVNGGWKERPNLWFALVGNSGVKKTPSVKAAIRPLEELDQELDEKYRVKLTDYNKQTKKQKETTDKPIPKQFLVDDITIEALSVVLLRNPNGVLLKKDELISWISDSTRYSGGGGGAEQRWMSLYSGESFRLNRKQDDEVTYVKNGFVNVVGGIQPAILPQLFTSNREFNGFINRIMFCYPSSLTATVPKGEVDKDLYGEYKVYMKTFIELPTSDSKTGGVLKLTKVANETFKDWQESFVYPSRNNDKLPDALIGAVAKLEAVALRFALIIEFTHRLSEKTIPVDICEYSMAKGIEMADYFYSNFESIYFRIKGDGTSDKEKIGIDFKRLVDEKIDRGDIVRRLYKLGYTNAQINKYLGYNKSSINHWVKVQKK